MRIGSPSVNGISIPTLIIFMFMKYHQTLNHAYEKVSFFIRMVGFRRSIRYVLEHEAISQWAARIRIVFALVTVQIYL